MATDSGPKRLIFIFDSTRLRSHLFFRFVSTSPNVRPIYHPFLMAAMFGPERIEQNMRHSEVRRKELEEDLVPLYGEDTFASCKQQFVQAVESAKNAGKIPLSNEHWFNVIDTDKVYGLMRGRITQPEQLGNNPTFLADEIFHALTPVILIRHPINAIDSIYRTALQVAKKRPGDEDFELITCNKPLRLLFDYFQQRQRAPIVVDGDDILWRTDELSKNLRDKLGLEQLSQTWEPTSEAEIKAMNPLIYKITEDIQLSRGIQRPDGPRPDEPHLDVAVSSWTAKYGPEVAEQLKGLVEDNMPHYLYLRKFKT
jgi:hypothetical protein